MKHLLAKEPVVQDYRVWLVLFVTPDSADEVREGVYDLVEQLCFLLALKARRGSQGKRLKTEQHAKLHRHVLTSHDGIQGSSAPASGHPTIPGPVTPMIPFRLVCEPFPVQLETLLPLTRKGVTKPLEQLKVSQGTRSGVVEERDRLLIPRYRPHTEAKHAESSRPLDGMANQLVANPGATKLGSNHDGLDLSFLLLVDEGHEADDLAIGFGNPNHLRSNQGKMSVGL